MAVSSGSACPRPQQSCSLHPAVPCDALGCVSSLTLGAAARNLLWAQGSIAWKDHRLPPALCPLGTPLSPPWVGYPQVGEQQQPHAMRMTHEQ